MARFDKLEFNVNKPPAPDAAAPEPLVREAGDWMKKADEQRRTGLYETALKYYGRALELDNSLVPGWLGQVQMLVQLGEYPEADLWSRKALELFPANGELMAGRAQALCRIRDRKLAQACSDGSLQQTGQSAYRWIVRGEIMLARRQDMDRHCFDKAQELDGDWLVPLEIALVYMYYGKLGKALDRARRAVELGPQSHYAWYVQGRCQAGLGFNGPARQSLQRSLELCPRDEKAARQLERVGGWGWWPLGILRRLFGR